VVTFTLRPLYPRGRQPTKPIQQDAGWAAEPVETFGRRDKTPALLGDQTTIPRPLPLDILSKMKYTFHMPTLRTTYSDKVLSLIWSATLLSLSHSREMSTRKLKTSQYVLIWRHLGNWDLKFLLRSALFWGVTQRQVVIFYRRFETTYLSHPQGWRCRVKLHWTSWPLKMGPIRCPETSVKYFHPSLRNTPEESRSHQHQAGNHGKFLTAVLNDGILWYDAVQVHKSLPIPFFESS
jgi:hypothetical protein